MTSFKNWLNEQWLNGKLTHDQVNVISSEIAMLKQEMNRMKKPVYEYEGD